MLQRCVEPLVDHLDAAVARIWTLDAEENVLVLQASAGLSADINGSNSRVPVGQNEIGLIAEDRKPHVNNDVLGDEHNADREWAQHEDLFAFAGYPLLLEDRVVGVVAVFARHTIASDTVDALGAVAGALAQGVDRKQVEQRLLESEMRQRGILQDALASVTGGRFRLCASADDLPEPLPGTLEPIPLTKESLRAVRLRATEAAKSAGLSTERINDLVTAVGEATMNAVTHAHDGVAHIRVDGNEVQVWIEDQGGGIEMNRLPEATLRHGHSTAGTLGHGFKMMLQTTDRLWLLTGLNGTTVVLEQGREAPLPNWLTET